MIKKLITISVFLVMLVGMLGLVGLVQAAGDDVIFSANTVVDIYYLGTTDSASADLQVNSSSQVETFAVGTDSVTITLSDTGNDSDITFESSLGTIMSVDCADGATFTAGVPSTMQIVYNASCTTVVLTIGSSTLTELNVKATPLTASATSSYTVTFRTVNALTSGQKIKLVFGGGFTILGSSATTTITTLTDDGTDISLGITAFASVANTRTITITLATDVAAMSVINIVLDRSLVTNPSTVSADVAVSAIDIFTTTAAGATIDSKADQTAFNRVIDLEPGWNIFASSQALEVTAYATVLAPISGSYSAIYTLVWDTGVTPNTMTWQTPTSVTPLTGYAIYITGGSTIKLPLDFAKETVSNSLFSRNLDNAGWYLIGYTGTATNPLESQDAFLDGLTVAGNLEYSVVVDLTGTAVNNEPSSHDIDGGATTEVAATGDTAMDFYMDFGYALFTTADSLVLGGSREE